MNNDILKNLDSSDERVVNKAALSLYDAIHAQVMSFVLSNKGGKVDAEDVIQEAIAILLVNVQKEDFHITGSVKSYVYGICRNLWYKQLSKKGRLPLDELKDYSMSDEVEDDTEEEVIVLISDLIETLSEECQKIVALFYFDRLSMDEIARRMGYKQRTVAKTKKYKCIQALKKLVLGHPQLKEILY